LSRVFAKFVCDPAGLTIRGTFRGVRGVACRLEGAGKQPPSPLESFVCARRPEITAVLGRLREVGARLLVASNSADALAFADVPLRLPATPEWLSPLSAIIPGQLFAYHLALAKQLDPDKPRNIKKVTRTL
jgi:hypothetical protein